MARKKTQSEIIDEAVARLKVGEMKMIRVGPGREGRILVKKGPPSGGPTLLKGIADQQRRAKVIGPKRKRKR